MAKSKRSMIVTRTPLRVSLMGGGTDLAEFYVPNGKGAVISLAIDKYIYVVLKQHANIFDEQYRISYSKTEVVDSVESIENNVVRECIKAANVQERLFVSTFADIPAASGLGSSSALTVGLMNALHAFKGEPVTRQQLAELACDIEISRLGQPIGKQDQYAVAFGGLHHFEFLKDGNVRVSGLKTAGGYLANLFKHATLYWTGLTRNVETILEGQKSNFEKGRWEQAKAIYDMVKPFHGALTSGASPRRIGEMIHESWMLKKRMANKISNDKIDEYYQSALEMGAFGGKICGGGGGGFLLLFHPVGQRRRISESSNYPYHFRLGMDFSGTEILLVAD